MNRLLDIGFELAGHWSLNATTLSFELIRHGSQRNILYAFVCDGEVKYVGKTIQSLRSRMNGYKNPGASQITNVRNNLRLKEQLNNGAAVDILALPDNGLLHYGQFHYNLAAGLEDSIIKVLKPEWNGKPRPTRSDSQDELEPPLEPIDIFQLVLHPSYFNSGFFNVPVAHSASIAEDAEPIEIFCGGSTNPISGAINRRANQNNSPRILGGTGLRDWFQSNLSVMQKVTVTVHTPNSICIDS